MNLSKDFKKGICAGIISASLGMLTIFSTVNCALTIHHKPHHNMCFNIKNSHHAMFNNHDCNDIHHANEIKFPADKQNFGQDKHNHSKLPKSHHTK